MHADPEDPHPGREGRAAGRGTLRLRGGSPPGPPYRAGAGALPLGEPASPLRALALGTRVYNPLHGRGDMAGKQYLLDLTAAGYPVIPTVDRPEDLHRLPAAPQYAVKPEAGADSIGLRFMAYEELAGLTYGGLLVQPRIDFRYEVSFYFVDDLFQYALYAPDPERRWVLEPYEPTPDDRAFARRFIDWNTLDHGIQRVDACRTPEGGLLLVELEDLNPYLSLDRVAEPVRERFADTLARSLHAFLAA